MGGVTSDRTSPMLKLAGFVETVRVLLAAGGDPRLTATQGRAALIAAKRSNHPAVVALLEARFAELAGSG